MLIIPIINVSAAKDPVNGHGLLSTKWKGCMGIS